MAFGTSQLGVLSYTNGFTLWHYRAKCELSETASVGYFNAASDMFAVGDMVLISATDGGCVRMVVNKAIGSNVILSTLF